MRQGIDQHLANSNGWVFRNILPLHACDARCQTRVTGNELRHFGHCIQQTAHLLPVNKLTLVAAAKARAGKASIWKAVLTDIGLAEQD